MGDGGRAEAGPTVPQCSPGPGLGPAWPGRKSRGCAIRPGCGSGRALFGFGAGTLRPHPSLGLPGWLTHPTGVCWRPGAGKGWDFSPPFCRLAGSGLPLSCGRWGDSRQRGAVRLAGELVFSPSLWAPPCPGGGGEGRPSGPLARELLCPPLQVMGQGEQRVHFQPHDVCCAVCL